MVSINDLVKIDVNKVSRLNISKVIENLINKHKDVNLGFWIDNDILYVDISENIKDLETALELGKKYNQKAIWDNTNNTEITIQERV